MLGPKSENSRITCFATCFEHLLQVYAEIGEKSAPQAKFFENRADWVLKTWYERILASFFLICTQTNTKRKRGTY